MSYEYTALPPISGAFRICILHKGERDDLISIDLVTVQHGITEVKQAVEPKEEDEELSYQWFEHGITDGKQAVEPAGEYETLSYQWYLKEVGGDKNTILVDNKDFIIGRNLYLALLEIREMEVDRKVWIDAICIDQGNVDERNVQIDLMEAIYSEATGVLIWLGPSYANSELAMSLFLDWSEQLKVRGNKEVHFRGRGKEGNDQRTHEAVLNLCTRSYWTRVWIIQEVWLARKWTLHCGQQSVLWSKHIHAVLLRYRLGFNKEQKGMLQDSTYHYLIVQSTLHRKKERLSFWLHVFPDTKCSDPRDLIYGLSSLCTDSAELQMDYRKSLFEVYQDVINLYKNEQGVLIELSERLQKKFKEFGVATRGPETRRISLDGLLAGTLDDSQGAGSTQMSTEIEIVAFQTGVFQKGFNEPANFQERRCCDKKFSVPGSAKPGDWVCLFKTSAYALVLRKTGDPRIFELVGRAFRTDKPPLLDQYGGCESAWTPGEFDRINSVTVNMDSSTLQRLLEPGSEATERRRL